MGKTYNIVALESVPMTYWMIVGIITQVMQGQEEQEEEEEEEDDEEEEEICQH